MVVADHEHDWKAQSMLRNGTWVDRPEFLPLVGRAPSTRAVCTICGKITTEPVVDA